MECQILLWIKSQAKNSKFLQFYATSLRYWSCVKNCLLKHVVRGKVEKRIEVMGGRGRRSKHLLDVFQKQRAYWELVDKSTLLSAKISFGKVLGTCLNTLRIERLICL